MVLDSELVTLIAFISTHHHFVLATDDRTIVEHLVEHGKDGLLEGVVGLVAEEVVGGFAFG